MGAPDDGVFDLSIKCSTASMATPARPNAAPLESRLPSPLRRREPPINSPPKSFSGLNIVSSFFMSSLKSAIANFAAVAPVNGIFVSLRKAQGVKL